jgi:hypothetical protein
MFTIECPNDEAHSDASRRRSRVLVTETRIRALRNTADGILLDIECWCGQWVTLRTGRRVAAPGYGSNL